MQPAPFFFIEFVICFGSVSFWAFASALVFFIAPPPASCPSCFFSRRGFLRFVAPFFDKVKFYGVQTISSHVSFVRHCLFFPCCPDRQVRYRPCFSAQAKLTLFRSCSFFPATRFRPYPFFLVPASGVIFGTLDLPTFDIWFLGENRFTAFEFVPNVRRDSSVPHLPHQCLSFFDVSLGHRNAMFMQSAGFGSFRAFSFN